MERLLPVMATSLLLSLTACTPEAPAPPPTEESRDVRDPVSVGGDGQVFTRDVVFLSSLHDSLLVVPWFFSARTREDAVERSVGGWLHRGGFWEAFFADTWESPPSRVPWRLLPRRGTRILVGMGDALERIVFSDGARNLEVGLVEPLVEWRGPSGDSFRLFAGELLLSSEVVSGHVLDVSRAAGPLDAPSGDWAILASGDSLQVVLENSRADPSVRGGDFHGWARLDFRQLTWPDLVARWTESRAFEQARREVPIAWSIDSRDGDVAISLTTVGAHLEAGAGDGAQLPVDALVGVEGTVAIVGVSYPVRGFLRHIQP